MRLGILRELKKIEVVLGRFVIALQIYFNKLSVPFIHFLPHSRKKNVPCDENLMKKTCIVTS